jgi:hypothetical protein
MTIVLIGCASAQPDEAPLVIEGTRLVRQDFEAIGPITTVSHPAVWPGNYLCTVDQKAGISVLHLEGRDQPQAFVSQHVNTRFAMRIEGTPDGGGEVFRVIELPYTGPDRDPHEWQSANSVLHGEYIGEWDRFFASEDQGFLRVGNNGDETIWFYHSGFEYAGGEDASLTVRSGNCTRQQP